MMNVMFCMRHRGKVIPITALVIVVLLNNHLSIECSRVIKSNDNDDSINRQFISDKSIIVNQTSENDFNNHLGSNKDFGDNIYSKRLNEDANKLSNGTEDEKTDCILGNADIYLSWWLNSNGTLKSDEVRPGRNSTHLDLSNRRLHFEAICEFIRNIIRDRALSPTNENIRFVSLAHCELNRIPDQGLSLINDTIEYLSLSGNNFHISDWIRLPKMPKLIEFDLRNCNMSDLPANIFDNFSKLRKLYLSYNRFTTLSSAEFSKLSFLKHLDLSHNNYLCKYAEDPFKALAKELDLDKDFFQHMKQLKFLDMSHTKITQMSSKAFLHLSKNLEQMSICYTAIPIIAGEIFYDNNLKVIDISGNAGATPFVRNSTSRVESALEILAYENASVKNFSWIWNFSNLKVLMLRENNINQLTPEVFENLKKLEILDLSSNHISNWYRRVFENNRVLRVLDLSKNNINVLTIEMLKDFDHVDYLAIGKNNFVCNCMLKEFIEAAAKNTKNVNCTFTLNPELSLLDGIDGMNIMNVAVVDAYDVIYRVFNHYVATVAHSFEKIQETFEKYGIYKIKRSKAIIRGIQKVGMISKMPLCNYTTLLSSTRGQRKQYDGPSYLGNVTIQLIDYEEQNYGCIDSATNREHLFIELDTCDFDRSNNFDDDDSNIPTSSFITFLIIFLSFGLAVFVIYYVKWSYLKYFCIILRNATVLSLMKQDKEHLLNRRESLASTGSTYMYDVFVSYSDPNRQWVLDELLPNIELTSEINVCLHERDFQVGISILENIIYCMDRSRALLLVMSESFLMSHWCQFEMHLAQHRLLETCRENLILVLLEDISKGKRPKILQYLMKTKTYIVWPTAGTNKNKRKAQDDAELDEQRKLFWKRLKKAIKSGNDWDNDTLTITSSSA